MTPPPKTVLPRTVFSFNAHLLKYLSICESMAFVSISHTHVPQATCYVPTPGPIV